MPDTDLDVLMSAPNAGLELWWRERIDGGPWDDPPQIISLIDSVLDLGFLGGTRGWNFMTPQGDPVDTITGIDLPAHPGASGNNRGAGSVQVDLQYRWVITKDRIPFLVKWFEGVQSYDPDTGRPTGDPTATLKFLQMGSGLWDTDWIDLPCAGTEQRAIADFIFFLPWLV